MNIAPKGHITTGHRAFTLIELLVVIAIIGILSSVVLASLNTARNKGADAAIKSNLANARAEAELYYDSNSNSYDPAGATNNGVCEASGTNVIGDSVAAAAAAGSTATSCFASATAWAAYASLKTSATNFYCVDSAGYASTTVVSSGTPNITDGTCP